MRLSIIGITLVILTLLCSIAFGQSAPVLNWGVALEGYQIERSFDNVNFKVVATVPPNVLTYTDTAAVAEAPPNTTQICYRIVPILTDGPSFFNDPVCVPFSNVPKITITMDNVSPGTSRVGGWNITTATQMFGADSLQSGNLDGTKTFRWTPSLTKTGTFLVAVWVANVSSPSTAAQYTIRLANGNLQTVTFDQTTAIGHFQTLGTFVLGPGSYVELRNVGVGLRVSADAIRFTEQ